MIDNEDKIYLKENFQIDVENYSAEELVDIFEYIEDKLDEELLKEKENNNYLKEKIDN